VNGRAGDRESGRLGDREVGRGKRLLLALTHDILIAYSLARPTRDSRTCNCRQSSEMKPMRRLDGWGGGCSSGNSLR